MISDPSLEEVPHDHHRGGHRYRTPSVIDFAGRRFETLRRRLPGAPSCAEIASRAKVSPALIKRLENGEGETVSFAEMNRIAKCLGYLLEPFPKLQKEDWSKFTLRDFLNLSVEKGVRAHLGFRPIRHEQSSQS